MKRSPRPRATAKLSQSLHQQLNTYALAAGAAGVGMLALVQPAEAKIVYTPAHVRLVSKPFALDLNHDGIVDFFLLHYYPHYDSGTNSLLACHGIMTYAFRSFCSSAAKNPQNAIRAIESMGGAWGAALRPGAKIQRGDRFQTNGADGVALGEVQVFGSSTNTQNTRWSGPWLDGGKGLKKRYLGIRFEINGRLHFGWARMTITTTRNTFTATLTGYAYETIPGKAIVAGNTKGPNVTMVYPASLGHLAAGASAIPAWRVTRTAATTH